MGCTCSSPNNKPSAAAAATTGSPAAEPGVLETIKTSVANAVQAVADAADKLAEELDEAARDYAEDVSGDLGTKLIQKEQGTMNLGDVMPNFEADTTVGKIKLHDYFGSGWGVLFSHPADFTPVCTTELNLVNKYLPEFASRNCKVIALSCDPVDSHRKWAKDVLAYDEATKNSTELAYPIIADEKRVIASQLGMLDAVAKDAEGTPLTARAVFIVGPDKTVKLSILYPASTGRNFDELIRVLDSLQLTAERKLATPADWEKGQDCIVSTSVSNEDAAKMFPAGVRTVDLPSKKSYLRFTAFPEPAQAAPAEQVPAAAAPPAEPRRNGLNLGDTFPNFTADSTQGKMKFYDFLGSSWGILFSHP